MFAGMVQIYERRVIEEVSSVSSFLKENGRA
jgi:hypothetical protein